MITTYFSNNPIYTLCVKAGREGDKKEILQEFIWKEIIVGK